MNKRERERKEVRKEGKEKVYIFTEQTPEALFIDWFSTVNLKRKLSMFCHLLPNLVEAENS